MSNKEPLKAPGRGPLVPAPTINPSSTVGKRTLVPEALLPGYMSGTRCDTEIGPACMLSVRERDLLIGSIGDRTSRALASYGDACTELKLGELAKSDETKMPWLVELLLSIVVDVADDTVKLAIQALHLGGKEHLAKMTRELLGSASWAIDGYAALEAVSPASIHKNLKHVVDLKKLAKVTPPKSSKMEAVSFLSSLQDRAILSFQAIAETSPQFLTDGELFVLCAALNSQFHTMSVYKNAIKEKLARFHASKVMQIGGMANVTRANPPPTGSRSNDVAWTPTATEEKWSGYDGPVDMTGPGSTGRSGSGRIAYGVERKVALIRYGSGVVPDHFGYMVRGELVEPVPPEFAEYAVARHVEVFGEDPVVHMEFEHEHPRKYFSEPQRIAKSAYNLRQVVSTIPMPTMRLGR